MVWPQPCQMTDQQVTVTVFSRLPFLPEFSLKLKPGNPSVSGMSHTGANLGLFPATRFQILFSVKLVFCLLNISDFVNLNQNSLKCIWRFYNDPLSATQCFNRMFLFLLLHKNKLRKISWLRKVLNSGCNFWKPFSRKY